jgi:MFS family permease
MVPNLVPVKDLSNAFSMQSIASNTGSVAGPMLGGVVIATIGQGYTYLFNAISFLAVIVALFLIGPVAQETRKSAGVTLSAMKDGLQFIFKRPMILSTMLLDFVATFFASANTMMPIVARDILKVGEVGYGFLSSAQAVGSVLAGLVISQLHNLRRQGPVFLGAVVVFGATTVLFGISHLFFLALLALVLMGAADAVSTIIRNTIRQLQTPDPMRGRMTSINQIFFQGGPQLGEVEAGVVGQLFGVPFAIISGGIGCIVGTFLIILKWPQVRLYDREAAIPVIKLA